MSEYLKQKGNNAFTQRKANRTDSEPNTAAQLRQLKENMKGSPFQLFSQEEEEVQAKTDNIQLQEEEELQMKEASGSEGTKTEMPQDVKSKMENSFGTDFSGVNIHQNSDQATNLGALAYTQGNNVHFAPGQYEPGSQKGQELLGHELTHVVQQREGRVKPDTEQHKGININSDTSLEKEADEMGAKAAQGKMANVRSSGNGVQMKEDDANGYIYYEYGKYDFSDFYVQYLMAEGKGLLGGWSKVNGQVHVYRAKNGKSYAKVSATGFSPAGTQGSVEFYGDVDLYSNGQVLKTAEFEKFTGASIGNPGWDSLGEALVELPSEGSDIYLRLNIGYIYREGVGAAAPIPAQGHTKVEIPHSEVDAVTHG